MLGCPEGEPARSHRIDGRSTHRRDSRVPILAVGFDDELPSRREQWTLRDLRGLVKVNPLLSWTRKDVWNFILRHDVPYNPLHDQGYPSIGCWPCTAPVGEGEDERAGRWAGSVKKECGLHVIEVRDGGGI